MDRAGTGLFTIYFGIRLYLDYLLVDEKLSHLRFIA